MMMNRGLNPLTMDQVKAFAPSVFSNHAREDVSERYTFIPTYQVMQSLINEGWNVYKAQQNRVMVEGKREFTKHLLRFRKSIDNFAVGDIVPEIMLANSHDRASAYQMHAGIFRFVCLNGMVVADSTFAHLKIRHSGNVINEVLSGADQIAKEVPMIMDEVNSMKAIDLTPDERGIFARAAAIQKYDEVIPFDPTMLLLPKRREDTKTDLWSTFNLIQENLTKGGVRYYTPSHSDDQGRYIPARRNRTREIKSINEDTKINKALWLLATEMKKLKTN
jgi:hypothetical protein